ncbi:D-glycero-alpha-D-manno-heptose-1,7-bisphosphate 7-phosphatase [Streptomyces sp. NPDC020747]|uniref:D-glycero-alpha-D-manno-heptose-1,7-bisphosphate 7-phosphatase n=1 Tax=Streptomyces sp. NPDC020747 TaxID=3365086 RepID=UPI0037BC7AC7
MSLPEILILDRDGVLFRHVEPYILFAHDVTVSPGAEQTVRTALELGVAVAVVTNQSPIGRGLTSWEFVHEVNARIHAWAPEGIEHRLRCYVCPHLPDDKCDCRKPLPGLLLQGAHDAGVDIGSAWMVGDHDTDMTAARAAGCGLAMHMTTGRQAEPSKIADICIDDLHTLIRLLRDEGGIQSTKSANELRRRL